MNCSGTLARDFNHCLWHALKGVAHHLSRRSRGHWFIIACILIVGTIGGHLLGTSDLWIELRYAIYQTFSQLITLHPPYPKRTVLVLVDDADFWYGKFDHRTPLKRDLLADLFKKIDAANPEVIALDVDLRSHALEPGQSDDPAYRDETQKLLDAVGAISKRRTVVLAKSVKYAGEGETEYVAESSVYDVRDFGDGRVMSGYITLPKDIRRVALDLKLHNGVSLDSFASAIARAADDRSLVETQEREKDALPYGTFIAPGEFVQLPARDVLNANLDDEKDLAELKKKLGFKIVIIGGAWHEFGPGPGPMHDGHSSPVGEIYGAFIHANYTEALLGTRTYRPMREWMATGIEVFFSVVMALIFSLHIRLVLRFAAAAFLCTFVVGVSYVSWQNLGLFFDFFTPVVLLASHAVIDKMRE